MENNENSLLRKKHTLIKGGRRGHWAVYFSDPKILILTEKIILCIIIGNLNQFMDHCLIPLDPWLLFMIKGMDLVELVYQSESDTHLHWTTYKKTYTCTICIRSF